MGRIYISNRRPNLKLSAPGIGILQFEGGRFTAKDAAEEAVIENSISYRSGFIVRRDGDDPPMQSVTITPAPVKPKRKYVRRSHAAEIG